MPVLDSDIVLVRPGRLCVVFAVSEAKSSAKSAWLELREQDRANLRITFEALAIQGRIANQVRFPRFGQIAAALSHSVVAVGFFEAESFVVAEIVSCRAWRQERPEILSRVEDLRKRRLAQAGQQRKEHHNGGSAISAKQSGSAA